MAETAKFSQPLPTTSSNLVDGAARSIERIGSWILEGLVLLGESSVAAKKAKEFQALNALSDEALAKRGLTRDGLASFVFGPLFS
ncbi:MAG: hypothetical protein AAFN27_13350 [Pseudomonadota bacterium]